MDFQKLSKIPKGIPVFEPSLKNGLKFLLYGSDAFCEINHDEGPFNEKDLAWHATRCQGLEFYADCIITTFICLIYVLLLFFGNSVPTFKFGFLEILWPPFKETASTILWYISLFYFLTYLIRALQILFAIITWIPEIFIARGGTWLDNLFDQLSVVKKAYFFWFGYSDRDTIIKFFETLIKICMISWLLHIILGIEFSVSIGDNSEVRMLSVSEFFYFFSITYTTVGYGDVTPADSGSRILVVLINFLTIISIIFWYDQISKGSKKLLTADIKNFYDGHLNRIRQISDNVSKFIIRSEDEISNGKVICPRLHPKDRKSISDGIAKDCKVCKGKIYVDKDTAISGAAWPDIRLETFIRRIKEKP